MTHGAVGPTPMTPVRPAAFAAHRFLLLAVVVAAICHVACRNGARVHVLDSSAVHYAPSMTEYAVQTKSISSILPTHRYSTQHARSALERIKHMFDHGFENYMRHAFPHDELKPISATYTDSLCELGGSAPAGNEYQGVAMTLIDALDTLAVVGNYTAFRDAVRYVSNHVTFDHDIRVNVFEVNIRILGGLLSAHLLAGDPALSKMTDYDGGLLRLAEDLGRRLLAAFKSPSGIPYAWVNLRHGVMNGETSNTCTAGVGTLILEFGMLSNLTGNMEFYDSAYSALITLWEMRDSRTGLVGNNLDVITGRWIDDSAGIGAGIDSFYEYLFKAFVLFGNAEFLRMFEQSYESVMKHLRVGPWYHEASMSSGLPTYMQFNSLQAFWPGLQVLSGSHLQEADLSQRAFFSIWAKYGALPERFLLGTMSLHSTERYYPLRPELMESTYMLFLATGDSVYRHMGEHMAESLFNTSYVRNGFASIRDVEHRVLEDRMPSFFLAETCKYLYLLFDPDSFVHRRGNYVFTTEGHLFPIDIGLHRQFANRKPRIRTPAAAEMDRQPSLSTCSADFRWLPFPRVREHASLPICPISDEPDRPATRVRAYVQDNAFYLEGNDGSHAVIRHLGTPVIEFLYEDDDFTRLFLISSDMGVVLYTVEALGKCNASFASAGSDFGPSPDAINDVQGPVVILSPADGCDDYQSDTDVQGKIVVVDRGGCTFMQKAQVAMRAGARALIISNTLVENDVFFMGGDGSIKSLPLPTVMTTGLDGKRLSNCLDLHGQVTVRLNVQYSVSQDGNSKVQSGPVSVMGSADAFLVDTGGWKVLCQRRDQSYSLAFLS
ncbi:alpha-1,2-Mannosidase [Plasmodiophora brassicae]